MGVIGLTLIRLAMRAVNQITNALVARHRQTGSASFVVLVGRAQLYL